MFAPPSQLRPNLPGPLGRSSPLWQSAGSTLLVGPTLASQWPTAAGAQRCPRAPRTRTRAPYGHALQGVRLGKQQPRPAWHGQVPRRGRRHHVRTRCPFAVAPATPLTLLASGSWEPNTAGFRVPTEITALNHELEVQSDLAGNERYMRLMCVAGRISLHRRHPCRPLRAGLLVDKSMARLGPSPLVRTTSASNKACRCGPCRKRTLHCNSKLRRRGRSLRG